MAGNPIASLFAQLGFRVDRTGLKAFQKDLQTTAKKIDSSSKKSVGGATDSARQKQSKFFKEITANYSKVRPNLMQMQRDLKRIEGAFVQNRITHKEYMEARRRVTEQIGKLEKQKEAAHQRALKETANEQKRLDKQTEISNKKQQTALSRIEKTYDKHRFQLKQVRNDYKFIQQQWRSGNITLEQRERQLNQLIVKYRQLQAAQAGAAGGRVGSAGGAFAGGADPRQVGNHRIISAIHSDIGLGAMVGGFAIAQSSRAFQNVKAMEQGLAAATGSFEKGAAEMEYLIELSQKLGLFVGDLGEDYAKFAASARDTNLTAKDQREVFKGVAAQVKILNLSAADSKRIFRALSQMMSSGQIMAQELKLQMGDQLPGAMRAMARAAHKLGITQDDSIASMNKAMEQGKLMSEEILPVFANELWEAANQGGALEEAMKTTSAAIGRFQTNVWLANKTLNEAGLDKTVRDFMNTVSDSIKKAEPFWIALGKLSEFLFFPLRALFEIFGSLASNIGIFGDAVEGNEQKVKLLGLAVASLFRWSRKLLAVFLLIPAALSGASKLIDGEQLTWQEWALTLAGIAVSLPLILKAMRGIKNLGGIAGSIRGGASGAAGRVSETAQRAARDVSRGQPSRLAADWTQGRSSSVWQRIGEGVKRGASSRGAGGFLPIGMGSVLSEEEFTQRQQQVPWWDLIGRLEQKQQEMNQQAIISGDVTFNISGDNSEEIADEVLRTIQTMHRQAAINSPSEEK